MKEKILAIRKALSKNFNAAPVQYSSVEGCHHFNLELPKVTHRVRFEPEVVDNRDAANFKRLCKEIAGHLQRNPTGRPKQVLVTNTGLRDEEWMQDISAAPGVAA